MSSKKQMVSYTNEDAKDIHYYGKLREALKDYELMEGIKALPDDMILEIKAYVISPYKYMAELKLYKCPTFVMDEAGDIRRKLFFTDYYSGEPISLTVHYEKKLQLFKKNSCIQVHKLNGDFEIIGERRVIASNTIRNMEIINQMYWLNYNTKAQNRQLLKDLQIKGRTKLIHESRGDIIRAIMKGS